MFGCTPRKIFQEKRECSLGLIEYQVVHFREVFTGCQ